MPLPWGPSVRVSDPVCGLGGSLTFTQSRCREGDQVSALLTLRNRAPWGAWGVAVDCGRGNNDTGPDDDLRTGLAYAPGCCSTEKTFDFIPAAAALIPGARRGSSAGSPSVSGAQHGLSSSGRRSSCGPKPSPSGRSPMFVSATLTKGCQTGTAPAIGAIRSGSGGTVAAIDSATSTGPRRRSAESSWSARCRSAAPGS